MVELIEGFIQELKNNNISENTAKSYRFHIMQYRNWYKDSFGEELEEIYHTNILDYIVYLRNIKNQSAVTINSKLSAIRRFNKFLVANNYQKDINILKNDFIKIQRSMLNPCDITLHEVEEFRQKMLKIGIREYAIVTLLAYSGIRISEYKTYKY